MSSTRFAERAAQADLVITGEGRIDAQSAYGKLTGSVIAKAREQGRPVAAIVGGIGGGAERITGSGLVAIEIASEGAASLEDAMRRGEELIAAAAERLGSRLSPAWR
jgi:glycerate kinase